MEYELEKLLSTKAEVQILSGFGNSTVQSLSIGLKPYTQTKMLKNFKKYVGQIVLYKSWQVAPIS